MNIRTALTVLLLLVANAAFAQCYESEGPPGPRYKSSCAAVTDWRTSQDAACGDFVGSSCASGYTTGGGGIGYNRYVAPSTCYYQISGPGYSYESAAATYLTNANACSTGYSLIDGECKKPITCSCTACPVGEFRRGTPVPPNCGECEKKCPVDEHQGGHEFDPGEQSVCVTRREFIVGMGWSNVTGDGVAEIKCRARVTDGTSVCADMGQGTRCYADSFRTTGFQNAQNTGECSEDPPIQVDNEDICAAGDLWCKPNPGCPAGFTKGEFNGESLCVKDGESISNVPQTKSPLVPAWDPDEADPPDEFPPGPEGDGEEEDPNLRRVIGIGDGAAGVGGGGGSIEVDIETCGLPGKPPCKIDETGTPNGQGVDTDAIANLNTEAGKLGTALSDVVAGTGAPDRSWGFGINFPTTCTPFQISTNHWGTFTLDFCQWQPVVHDLMSLVWVGFGLFIGLGMVFRTIGGG